MSKKDKSEGKTVAANFDGEHVENELRKSEFNHRLIFQKSALPQLICTQKDLCILKVMKLPWICTDTARMNFYDWIYVH